MERLADEPDLAAMLGEVDLRTRELLDAAAGLDDAAARSPSRLPGWSRGHLLTHLARNADAVTGVLADAVAGRPATMYPSAESRDTAIEAGSQRSAADLVEDVRTSADRLRQAFRDFPADHLDARFTSPALWWRPVRSTPWLRLREVVLHHVDLGLGFTLADAPGVATALLREVATRFAELADAPPMLLVVTDPAEQFPVHDGGPRIAGSTAALAGWLTGRTPGDDLDADGPLPPLPAWT